jgi:hypothetical protein
MRFGAHILLAASLGFGVPAGAQDVTLSEEAWAGLLQVTYATTAAAKCDGATSNAKRMERAMLQTVGAIAASGQDPVAAIQFLETEAGKEQLAEREALLRARHGVPADGDAGLCEAIKAEAASDPALGKLVRFK